MFKIFLLLTSLSAAAADIKFFNTKYAESLRALADQLSSHGVAVEKVVFEDAILDKKVSVGLVLIYVKENPQPSRLQVNLELGGVALTVAQMTEELNRKSRTLLPRLALALSDLPAKPLDELKQSLKEVSEKKAAVVQMQRDLLAEKIKAGSYYLELAKANEKELRQRINGIGELIYVNTDRVVREVVYLSPDATLGSKDANKLQLTLEMSMLTFQQELAVATAEYQAQDGSKGPTETQRILQVILNCEVQLTRLTYLVHLFESYKVNMELHGQARVSQSVAIQEFAYITDNVLKLSNLEAYLKGIVNVAEVGLDKRQMSDLRNAMKKAYAMAMKLAAGGVYIEKLGHTWGPGAQLAELKERVTLGNDQVERPRLHQEALSLRTSILMGFAALNLELESLKRLHGVTDLRPEQILKQRELTYQMEHLKWQLNEVMKLEALTHPRRLK